MPEDRSRFRFPQIRRVVLEQFSLFENAPTIDVSIAPGVFCLAGANGLGKSTFLAAVNYGLTGRVPQPARTFHSAAEYYKDSLAYTRAYFAGRIREEDRSAAQITLWFTVGDVEFQVTRGMFDSDELRYLSMSNGHPSMEESAGGDRLHDAYVQGIAECTGILDFRQFVFLQLFLVTFDERRELLFWNELITEQVLYLAFGVDPTVAPRAEELRRIDERLESQARNQQYLATQAGQRLKKLQPLLGAADSLFDEELRHRFDGLQSERDEVAAALAQADAVVADAQVQQAAAVAQRARALDDYEQAFSRIVTPIRDPQMHPIVASSRAENRCQLCGHEGQHVQAAMEAAAEASECPLCRIDLTTDQDFPPPDLSHLDESVVQSREAATVAGDRLERVAAEAAEVRGRLESLNSQINELESQAGPSIHPIDSDVAESVRLLEVERSTATERRDGYRSERDAARSELRSLRATLGQQYATAELEFVPLFKSLAAEFLGLDIDIQMKSKAESLGFVLSVENEPRRVTESLSESQRFFVDIALRMALAKFMSADEAPASMFIDTPEGSLDIAYEAQAGEMFASFVQDGFNILMTANINTSQLLIELARRCGSSLMQLHRMTDWAVLSTVQRRAEGMFDSAFQEIEGALAGKDTL